MRIYTKKQDALANSLYIIVCLLCLPLALKAQTYQQIVDSLKQQLSLVTETTARIDLLNEISYTYRRLSGEETLKYAILAKQKAIKANYIKGQCVAHKNLGIAHYTMSSPKDSMMYHYEESIRLAEKINDYFTQAACYNNIALIFNNKEKPYLCIQYYLKGIEIFDTHVKEEKSLKALMLCNLAQFYLFLDQYKKALYYIERTYDLATRNNYQSILSICLDEYGKILIKLNRLEEAEAILNKGVEISTLLDDNTSKIWNWNYKVDLAIIRNQCELAKQYAITASQLASKEETKMYNAYISLGFAKVAYCENRYEDVLLNGQQAIQMGAQFNLVKVQQEARFLMAKAMEAKKDFGRAYQYSKTYHVIKDSIAKSKQLALAEELEVKYQTSEKEKEINFLHREQTLTNQYIQQLWGFMGIVVLAVLYILYLLFKRKESNELIETKNRQLNKYISSNLQLENFAYIASHDLKSPLLTITSFAELLQKTAKDRLKDQEMQFLKFIARGAMDMNTLISDILDFSLLQKSELKKEKIYLNDLLTYVLELNKTLIEEKNATIRLNIDHSYVRGDRSKLIQLLQNLILNAIKFQKANSTPEIDIVAFTTSANDCVVSVKDNGIGIDTSYFNKIFLLFKRLNDKKDYEGTGIGLAMCKKIVEMHKGEIWLESEVGVGTTFHFSLAK